MDTAKGKIPYIVLMVAAVLTLPAWLFIAYTSLFAFDAPGSEKDPSTWWLVVPIWIYPIILLGFGIGSWLLYRRKQMTWALALISMPLAACIVYVIAAAVYLSAAPH